MNAIANPISRTLAYQDVGQQWHVIGQEDIAAVVEPVVILGDPGIGKSVLTQTLGAQPGMRYCCAGTFYRAERPEALIAQGERIIVDGLDEIASSTPGGSVDSVLRQLSRMGSPPFVLSCREADWRGAGRPRPNRGRLWRDTTPALPPAVFPRRRPSISPRRVSRNRSRRHG